RGDGVTAVAAEQLVGPLARQQDLVAAVACPAGDQPGQPVSGVGEEVARRRQRVVGPLAVEVVDLGPETPFEVAYGAPVVVESLPILARRPLDRVSAVQAV